MTEILLPWEAFYRMLPFMFFGLLVHAFGKYTLAKRKPGYTLGTFLYLMWAPWVLALCYALIGCWFYLRGITIGIQGSEDIVALLMGVSGGSLGKTTVNLLTRKKSPRND